jgi:hypothetical protein
MKSGKRRRLRGEFMPGLDSRICVRCAPLSGKGWRVWLRSRHHPPPLSRTTAAKRKEIRDPAQEVAAKRLSRKKQCRFAAALRLGWFPDLRPLRFAPFPCPGKGWRVLAQVATPPSPFPGRPQRSGGRSGIQHRKLPRSGSLDKAVPLRGGFTPCWIPDLRPLRFAPFPCPGKRWRVWHWSRHRPLPLSRTTGAKRKEIRDPAQEDPAQRHRPFGELCTRNGGTIVLA